MPTTDASPRNPPSINPVYLVALPSAIFLVFMIWSTYTQLQIVESLTSFNARAELLLETQNSIVAAIAHRDNKKDNNSLPTPPAEPWAAYGGGPAEDFEHLARIEERLSELTKSISLLSSDIASASAPAAPSHPDMPPIPVVSAPSFASMEDITQTEIPAAPASTVSEESWMAADEILGKYAEKARLEMEALHAGGMLDAAQMERIKRETRMQAATELRERLPADVFEEMFPTEANLSAR